jgi:hypothetical protein
LFRSAVKKKQVPHRAFGPVRNDIIECNEMVASGLTGNWVRATENWFSCV